MDGHLGAPPLGCYTYVGGGGGELLEKIHPYTVCIQCVSAPWYPVDGHIGAPLGCYTNAGGGELLENWGLSKPEWYSRVMVRLHQRVHVTYMQDEVICFWKTGVSVRARLVLWCDG